jgi:hypothetical protein
VKWSDLNGNRPVSDAARLSILIVSHNSPPIACPRRHRNLSLDAVAREINPTFGGNMEIWVQNCLADIFEQSQFDSLFLDSVKNDRHRRVEMHPNLRLSCENGPQTQIKGNSTRKSYPDCPMKQKWAAGTVEHV